MAIGELSEEEVDTIVSQAEEKAMEAEAAAQEARRKKREEDRIAAIEAEHVAADIAAGRIPTAPTAPVDGGIADADLSDVPDEVDPIESAVENLGGTESEGSAS